MLLLARFTFALLAGIAAAAAAAAVAAAAAAAVTREYGPTIYQILLGWKTCKYYNETDELPTTQGQPKPKKK